MGSEYDPTEEVPATRRYEQLCSRRTTTKRGGIVCEVAYDLVEKFSREAWGSRDIRSGLGSRLARSRQSGAHFLAG